MMQLGAMPLSRYTLLHSEAKVTSEDLNTLKSYLSPWSCPVPQAAFRPDRSFQRWNNGNLYELPGYDS